VTTHANDAAHGALHHCFSQEVKVLTMPGNSNSGRKRGSSYTRRTNDQIALATRAKERAARVEERRRKPFLEIMDLICGYLNSLQHHNLNSLLLLSLQLVDLIETIPIPRLAIHDFVNW
jgi:hypothetical protein